MPFTRIRLPSTLSLASFDAIAAAFASGFEEPTTHALVLEGAEAGCFCRGMDLGGMVASEADVEAGLRRFATILAWLGRAPRPTVALVDGDATGGGLGLAAACDVVVATSRARFALPEALFGLVPGVVLPVLLERMLPQKARLLTLSGQSRSAAWAQANGLVDDVVEPEALERAGSRWARELGRAVPSRVRAVRIWTQSIGHLGSEAALFRGAHLSCELARDESVRERVRAFVEEGAVPWTPT